MAAAAAWGAFGDVIASFPAPANNARALGYAGGYLYCYAGTSPYRIYRINPANGSVVSSFVSAAGSDTYGLEWDGTYLDFGANSANRVYRATNAGSVASSFACSHIDNGLTWDGANFWVTDADSHFWRVNTSGSVLASFTTAFDAYDPAFAGNYLIVGSHNPSHRLYKLTTAGSVVASTAAPANFPWGATFDGTYLWVTTTTGTDRIWKLGAGPVWTDVQPASLGRVKALYR